MSELPSLPRSTLDDAAMLPARWVGERGLLLTTRETTLARYERLRAGAFAELEDLVPADGSLLLVLRPGATISPALRRALTAPLDATPPVGVMTHTLRVRYGGDDGPDLAMLAARAGLGIEAYIGRHAGADYTVAFLGFQPGFPYLQGLPTPLHAVRRATPRVRVPAGSIAVGGAYAGIYPASGPGGWHVIGRTTAALFDPARPAPALLRPGDRVRFVVDD